MNTRTRLLLGFMVLVVGAWISDQFGLLSFLDRAGSQSETDFEIVARQIQKAEDIIQLGVGADDKLTVLEKRSLPYDPTEARSAYQTWLSTLVNHNEIEKSTVEVDNPESITIMDADKKSKEAYKRYGFTVNGVGRLENVTRFLFAFYQAGHLHKITSLTITPSAGGTFTLSMAGEALGIATCDRKVELSAEVGDSCAFESIDEYARIVRRNIFSREGGTALKLVSLSSITFDKSGQPEAWFKVGTGQATKRLQRDSQLDISVHRIKVIDIQPRSVMLEIDGKLLDLPIGKNIRDALSAN